jgi:hypothetical protein
MNAEKSSIHAGFHILGSRFC